ncbi:arginine/serine-rich protein 1 [Patagioenas fasciata monilis]|uniref:Arginine/serine-rich protein 1 n=1 Tax=Patagioenas fasciata monilis TaxID=372326 RepID=A0A1V4JHG4_PATFA|nr:arginine/serine-rich protein 1 [Patagioenas fasciata monilis]
MRKGWGPSPRMRPGPCYVTGEGKFWKVLGSPQSLLGGGSEWRRLASPQEQDPCAGSPAGWSRSALASQGTQPRGCPAAPSGTETGGCRTTMKMEPASESTCAEKTVVRKTEDMTGFMDDLTLSSPKKRESSLRSKRSCDRSSTRSSSRSSCSSRSSSSSSSSASSRSWSRSRSRSRSRARRNGSRRYRRYSRSYSRSRSRSRGYRRYRGRYHARHYRRYRRSPPRYRSRSRSWSRGRSYYRRSYSRSRSRSRGRRYYGFGRTIYPEIYRSWRSRSRTRSRSRSPLHLSEKDKRELLEIAKANAAKALGTDNIVLPASLKILPPSKEIKKEKQEHEDAGESAEQPSGEAEDVTRSGMERAAIPRSISFSPNNTMAKPALQRPVSHVVKEPAASPAREEDKKGSPYGQWVPVKKEKKTFLNFSPKSAPFRAR